MAYYFNPKSFGAVFSLPSVVVDSYIKTATETQLRVILYLFRNSSEGIDIKSVSEKIGLPLSEVNDALIFWEQRGVLLNDKSTEEKPEKTAKKAVVKNEKPSRADVIKRGLEDKNIALILREAQVKFGRNLKTNESSSLVYIYDDLGLDISVILFLLQYALSSDKLNISFINKTAANWVNSGVETVSDAEEIIEDQIKSDLAWKRVMKAFGIKNRKPSDNEKKYARLWFDEWELKDEVLVLAYNVCVDLKSEFIFGYCVKIIDNWHKEGCVTPEEIKKIIASKGGKKNKNNNSYAAYDLDLFEKMLDSKDND